MCMCRNVSREMLWHCLNDEDDDNPADMVANAGRRLFPNAPPGLWRRIVGGDTVVFLGEEEISDELRDMLFEE